MGIVENFEVIKNNIREYERESHRVCGSVKLLAVSKGQPVEAIKNLYVAGQKAFAESYWQEAAQKIKVLSELDICWHFIGRIQKNKIKEIARHFSWVHSMCQLDHAQYLNEQREKLGRAVNVCIQVNISKDPNKAGILPEQLFELATQMRPFKYLNLRGLMTLPTRSDHFEQQRVAYHQLHHYYDQLRGRGFELDTLSMGMSADYKAAIAEAATMVRIGQALFVDKLI